MKISETPPFLKIFEIFEMKFWIAFNIHRKRKSIGLSCKFQKHLPARKSLIIIVRPHLDYRQIYGQAHNKK